MNTRILFMYKLYSTYLLIYFFFSFCLRQILVLHFYRLYLKGVGDDDIVLCTEDKTFGLKMVENSNTSLLCNFTSSSSLSSISENRQISSSSTPSLPTDVYIHGEIGGTHELLIIPPRLHRLQELLEMEIYNGPQEELDEINIIHQEYKDEYDELVQKGKITYHTKKRKIYSPSTSDNPEQNPSISAIAPDNQTLFGTIPTIPSVHNTQTTQTQSFEYDAVMQNDTTTDNHPDGTLAHSAVTDSDDLHILNYRRNIYDKINDGLQHPRSDRGYSFNELLMLVQASKKEIETGLQFIQAVEFPSTSATAPSRWRILNDDYIDNVLETILLALMADGLDTENIPVQPLITNIVESSSHLACVLHSVLRMFGKLSIVNDTEYISLDIQKVCIRRGIRLLKQSISKIKPNSLRSSSASSSNLSSSSTNKAGDASTPTSTSVSLPFPSPSVETSIPITEFITNWKKDISLNWPTSSTISIPDLTLDLLRGYILKDTLPNGTPVIYYFPHTKLHHEPSLRFNQLFSIRTTWLGDDIKPFLESLVTPANKLDDMMLKYTRMSVGMDKVRTYTSRLHGTAAK